MFPGVTAFGGHLLGVNFWTVPWRLSASGGPVRRGFLRERAGPRSGPPWLSFRACTPAYVRPSRGPLEFSPSHGVSLPSSSSLVSSAVSCLLPGPSRELSTPVFAISTRELLAGSFFIISGSVDISSLLSHFTIFFCNYLNMASFVALNIFVTAWNFLFAKSNI